MVNASENCIICGNEYDNSELKFIVIANKHTTKFRVCFKCNKMENLQDDFSNVKKIITNYLHFADQFK
jgi:hypothetical protein